MRAGRHRSRQSGFTYIGVLFLLVLLGLGLAGTGETWTLASRRAREKELLWVGNQYAHAIRSYYMAGPRQFPAQLEDLLEDRRFPEPKRHLRQLYLDPISHERFDPVLSEDGSRIAGVRSHSDETPLKQDNFPPKYRDFKGSTHYSDWLFIPDNLPGAPKRPGAAAATDPAAAASAPSAAGTTATPASPGTATPTPAAPAKPAPVRPGSVFSSTPG